MQELKKSDYRTHQYYLESLKAELSIAAPMHLNEFQKRMDVSRHGLSLGARDDNMAMSTLPCCQPC
jgi:hypothetical protein